MFVHLVNTHSGDWQEGNIGNNVTCWQRLNQEHRVTILQPVAGNEHLACSIVCFAPCNILLVLSSPHVASLSPRVAFLQVHLSPRLELLRDDTKRQEANPRQPTGQTKAPSHCRCDPVGGIS